MNEKNDLLIYTENVTADWNIHWHNKAGSTRPTSPSQLNFP